LSLGMAFLLLSRRIAGRYAVLAPLGGQQ